MYVRACTCACADSRHKRFCSTYVISAHLSQGSAIMAGIAMGSLFLLCSFFFVLV